MPEPSAPIHPQLRPIARWFPQISFSAGNLWLVRLLEQSLKLRRQPRDVAVENQMISRAGHSPGLRLRLYRPHRMPVPAPAILWLHGGGLIIGTPEQDDPICCQHARELGALVVSIDYRRAPEHPFPAALDDGYRALQWLYTQAARLGVDPGRIAVGGESAGGGLAAALAQVALDRREVPLAFQLLVYPMLDDRSVLRADLASRRWLGWNPTSNRFGWESYLQRACGAAELPAYAVPARRADLCGLPPAWIGVGSADLFYEEDLAYAQRLRDSGVDCRLEVVPGAFHGFDMIGPWLPLAKEFRQSQVAALRAALT